MGVVSRLLERILDKADVIETDFDCNDREKAFKYCLTKVATKCEEFYDGNRFGIKIKPVVIGELQKQMKEHALEHCPRSNQILTFFEGGESKWLIFQHKR